MKDPAALFFISDWLVATKEMKADERGWYLNLILHQFDKGDLPNDIEELANLADVRMSEYESFKQKWEQVLKQKFNLNESGRLENDRATTIIQAREIFKDKRSKSGIMGYIVKFAKNKMKATEEEINYAKENINMDDLDIKDSQMLKQVLKDLFKLYRNGIGYGDIIETETLLERVDNFERHVTFENKEYNILSDIELRKFMNYWTEYSDNGTKFRQEKQTTWNTKKRLERWSLNIKSNGKDKQIDQPKREIIYEDPKEFIRQLDKKRNES